MKTTPQALNIFKKMCFRSSAYALAAYFYALMLEKLLMMAGGYFSGFPISIDYHDVGVMADPGDWKQESVLMVYLFPYMIQAILVVLLYINVQKLQSTPGYMMIFIHWVMFFISFRLSGMIAVHLIFKTGIYYAFRWLYLGTSLEVIISVIGMVIFFIVGIWMLKGILFFSATYNDHYRVTGLPDIIRSSVLIPSLLVCFIAFLYFLPSLPIDEVAGLSMIALLSVYTVIRLLYGRQELLPKGEKVKEKFNASLIFSSVLFMVILLRIILGISFII